MFRIHLIALVGLFLSEACPEQDTTKQSVEEAGIRQVSEWGHPRIDTLRQVRYYETACHLEVRGSEVPIISGIPQAQEWNRAIASRNEQVLSRHCANQLERGSEPYTDPECRGCHSDTLHYVRSRFDVMTWTDSILSVRCTRSWKPHGGTAWWKDIYFFNIDVRTGDSLEMPFSLDDVDVAQADAHISESFNLGCNDSSGHNDPYDCHSCQSPSYLQKAQEEGRVGLVDGVWTAFETIWPSQCCHAAEKMVAIPLERLLLSRCSILHNSKRNK